MKKEKFVLVLVLALFALLLGSCAPDEIDPTAIEDLVIKRDTTWRTGSTPLLRGHIVVQRGTLTIEKGVTVRFAAGSMLTVEGGRGAAINIKGEVRDPVILEPETSSDSWKGLRIMGNSDQSKIQDCTISGAYHQGGAALHIENLSCDIAGLAIENCRGNAIEIDGVTANTHARLKVRRVVTRGGHAITGDAALLQVLEDNCEMRLDEGYGVELRSGTVRLPKLTIPSLDVPYYVTAQVQLDATKLAINTGTKLCIEKGASVDFGCNANTTLTATGVTFTSPNAQKGQALRGDVIINSRVTSDSRIEGCIFECGGSGNPAGGLIIYDVRDLLIRGCTFQQNAGYGLVLFDASLAAGSSNNQFYDNEMGEIGRVRYKR